MPTVDRINGLRVMVYVDDHGPPHVHVVGRGCEAVFVLNCPDGPPNVRMVEGFSDRDLFKIKSYIKLKVAQLCESWRQIHGHF